MNPLQPSKIKDEFWVQVDHPKPPQQGTTRSGKWLIFTPFNKLDEKWSVIACETEAGRLGISAKATTAKPNGLAKNSFTKVICVYTYDSSDKDDVFRVREGLRKLGFIKKLSYKTDHATAEGRDRLAGDSKPISLYFE